MKLLGKHLPELKGQQKAALTSPTSGGKTARYLNINLVRLSEKVLKGRDLALYRQALKEANLQSLEDVKLEITSPETPKKGKSTARLEEAKEDWDPEVSMTVDHVKKREKLDDRQRIDDKFEELETEKASMEVIVAKLKAEIKDKEIILKNLAEELETEKAKMRDTVEKLEAEIKDKETSLKNVTEELESEKARMEVTVAKLKAEITDKETTLKNLTEENSRLKGDLEKTLKEKKSVEDKLKASKALQSSLETQGTLISMELEETRASLEVLRQEKNDTEKVAQESSYERELLKEELEMKNDNLAEVRDRVEKVEEENKKLVDGLISQKIRLENDKHSVEAEAKRQLDDLQVKLNRAILISSHKSTTIKLMRQRLRKLRKLNSELATSSSTAKLTKEDKEQLAMQEAECENSEMVKDPDNTESHANDAKIIALTLEKDAKEEEVQNLKAEIKAVKESGQQSLNKIHEYRANLEQVHREKKNLTNELMESGTRVQNLILEKEALISKLKQMSDEVRELTIEIGKKLPNSSSSKEQEVAGDDLSGLERLSVLRDSVNDGIEKILKAHDLEKSQQEKTKAKCDDLENDLKNAQKKFDMTITELTAALEEAETEKKALLEQSDSVSKEANEANKALKAFQEAFEKKITHKDHTIDDLRTKLKTKAELAKEQQQQLYVDYQRVKEELSTKSQENDTLKAQLQTSTSTNDAMEGQDNHAACKEPDDETLRQILYKGVWASIRKEPDDISEEKLCKMFVRFHKTYVEDNNYFRSKEQLVSDQLQKVFYEKWKVTREVLKQSFSLVEKE